MQGFFNLLIFLFSKVVTIHNNHPDVKVWGALKSVFLRRQRFTEDEVIVLTGITMVQEEQENANATPVAQNNDEEMISYETSKWKSFQSRRSSVNEGESGVSADVSFQDSNVSSILVPGEETPKVISQGFVKRRKAPLTRIRTETSSTTKVNTNNNNNNVQSDDDLFSDHEEDSSMSTTEKNATTEEWDKRKPIKSRLLIKRRSGTREETVDSGNTVSKTTLNQIEEGRAFNHSSTNESQPSTLSL